MSTCAVIRSQSISQSIYLNQENPQNNKNSTEKHRNKACKNRQTNRQTGKMQLTIDNNHNN